MDATSTKPARQKNTSAWRLWLGASLLLLGACSAAQPGGGKVVIGPFDEIDTKSHPAIGEVWRLDVTKYPLPNGYSPFQKAPSADCTLKADAQRLLISCRGMRDYRKLDHESAGAERIRTLIDAVDWPTEAQKKLPYPADKHPLSVALTVNSKVHQARGGEHLLDPKLRTIAQEVFALHEGMLEADRRAEQGDCLRGQKFDSCPDPGGPATVCGAPICSPARWGGQSCTLGIHCASRSCNEGRCAYANADASCPHGRMEPLQFVPSEYLSCKVDADCVIVGVACSARSVSKKAQHCIKPPTNDCAYGNYRALTPICDAGTCRGK